MICSVNVTFCIITTFIQKRNTSLTIYPVSWVVLTQLTDVTEIEIVKGFEEDCILRYFYYCTQSFLTTYLPGN